MIQVSSSTNNMISFTSLKHGFRRFASSTNPKTVTEPKIPQPKSGKYSGTVSTIHKYKSTTTRTSPWTPRYRQELNESFKGHTRWLKNQPKSRIYVMLGSLASGVYILWNIENVPYTNRKHFVIFSKKFELWIGEIAFKTMKDKYAEKILSEKHPSNVRVKLISDKIITALYKEFDLRMIVNGKTLVLKNEIVENKSKGRKGYQSTRKHLNGLKWEVIVVDKPEVNACCLPGGKIVVFTGLLKHFKKDEEIATVIGHEVAHAVARHSAEKITKSFLFLIPCWYLYEHIELNSLRTLWSVFIDLPYSRRMEKEADYIGLLIMAAAGYDPHVAPTVYMKLGAISSNKEFDYLSTHPSAKKRAQSLSQDRVMKEALSIYRKGGSV